MSENYDGPWKQVVEEALPLVLALFYPDVNAAIDWSQDYVAVTQELHDPAGGTPVRVDCLYRLARLDSDDWLCLHLELQMSEEGGFARRMFDYWLLIRFWNGKPPVSLAVLGDDNVKWTPSTHAEGEFGTGTGFDFRPVKVVEWADRRAEVESGENLFGLFVAAHLETLATRKDDAARVIAKRRLLLNLRSRGLDEDEADRWTRVIGSLMKLPQQLDDELWKEIRQETEVSMKRIVWEAPERVGRAEGRAEGLAEGQALASAALLDALTTVLTERFPADAPALTPLLADADVGRLKHLLKLAVTAPLDAVRREIQGIA